MEVFDLGDREYIQLNDLLKVMGLRTSGGAAKAAIAEGLVRVDGDVELRKRCKIRKGQSIEFNGQKVVVK
ncbi:MAG TPA: RNA-binding S4 domain-containing protein [Thermodesulfovibrionales bacterium]|nr:RNA-binding S4 domain-containing protein [Thermodesulfovibrionales bacterium]